MLLKRTPRGGEGQGGSPWGVLYAYAAYDEI